MKKRLIETVAGVLLLALCFTACGGDGPVEPVEAVAPVEGDILILQAFGTGTGAAAASRSFVELYNVSDKLLDVEGLNLYYANGTRHGNLTPPTPATADEAWASVSLTGTLPAKTSYLILGPEVAVEGATYKFEDVSGDTNSNDFVLFNRAFKVALVQGTVTDMPPNPFNVDGNGAKVDGYLDMLGAANEYQTSDMIYGFETAPARNSGSEAPRRKNLTDTNDNSRDFISIRYPGGNASANAAGDPGVTFTAAEGWRIEHYRPKNRDYGPWDPMTEPPPPPPPPPTEALMILQANTYGNDNGGGGGFPRSLVELYNNTNAAIDLNAGNYYLHIGNNTAWTDVIKLTGNIPAQCSYLIVDNTATASSNTNATPRANLPAANQEAAFVLTNSNFVVAVLKNQSSTLTGNPFGNTTLADDYVDMLGCGTAIGFETSAASASRPQGPRRTPLIDTNNNSEDFATVDYRGTSAGNGMADDQLYKFWPRNVAAGAWNPITGEPAVHPTVP